MFGQGSRLKGQNMDKEEVFLAEEGFKTEDKLWKLVWCKVYWCFLGGNGVELWL